MHIDLVITELFVGGAERCLTELAVGLVARGDRVRVFSLGRLPEGEQALLLRRLRETGIEVTSGEADRWTSLPGCFRRLRGWMNEGRPDVCQTFLYHANVLGTYAARSAGVERRLGGLRVAEARPLRLFAERRAVTRMSGLICVSDAVREFAIGSLGCDPSTIRVIPNGVDVVRFENEAPVSWQRLGWPRDASVSLFVGRLHVQKGVDLLAAEIERLAPPATNRKLLIVGDGLLRDQVRRLCERIGSDRVRWLGWQPEIAPLMRAARVLLLPSRYEGLPNVALEAMASGLPVVFSRVEGSRELFPNDEGLQTFRTGDHAEMSRLATRFLEDQDLAAEVGAANRERVRERFSIAAMVDAYRACYRDL